MTLKRPPTAYNLLTRDQSIKDCIRREHPDWVYSQYMSEYARLWRSFTLEEKQPYKDQADLFKRTYEEKLANNEDSPSDEENEGKRLKRASTAFIQFSNEKRKTVKETNPKFSVKEVSTELGKIWKTMSDEDKTPYQDMYQSEKKRLQDNPVYVKKKIKKIYPPPSEEDQLQKYISYVRDLRLQCSELAEKITKSDLIH